MAFQSLVLAHYASLINRIKSSPNKIFISERTSYTAFNVFITLAAEMKIIKPESRQILGQAFSVSAFACPKIIFQLYLTPDIAWKRIISRARPFELRTGPAYYHKLNYLYNSALKNHLLPKDSEIQLLNATRSRLHITLMMELKIHIAIRGRKV